MLTPDLRASSPLPSLTPALPHPQRQEHPKALKSIRPFLPSQTFGTNCTVKTRPPGRGRAVRTGNFTHAVSMTFLRCPERPTRVSSLSLGRRSEAAASSPASRRRGPRPWLLIAFPARWPLGALPPTAGRGGVPGLGVVRGASAPRGSSRPTHIGPEGCCYTLMFLSVLLTSPPCPPDNFLCLEAVLHQNLLKYSTLFCMATWSPNTALPAPLAEN